MCEEIAENRLMIGTIRAKDCAEALLRVLALGVPAEDFAKAITAVLCQRLVRKLCEACKEAYAPRRKSSSSWGFPRAACRRSTGRPSRIPTSRRSLASSAARSATTGGRRCLSC